MLANPDIPMAKKRRPQSDPTKKPFTPETLDRTVIALPLLDKIEQDGLGKPQDVIIDINLEYPGGRTEAREVVWQWIDALTGGDPNVHGADKDNSGREAGHQLGKKRIQPAISIRSIERKKYPRLGQTQ